MKDRHYAYLAGLIDGDGCVVGSKSFVPRSNCFQYDVKLELTSKIRKTVNRLIELFGGYPTKWKLEGTTYWKWNLRITRNSSELLTNLSRFLVLKKQQCEIAREWTEIPRYKNVPSVRNSIVTRIQSVNQNHPMHLDDIPVNEGKTANSYFAGLMDAEGTLSILSKCSSWAPYVSVYNDSPRIMYWLQREFGGYYFLHKKPNHFMWKFQGSAKDRERFILSILPYLVTKRDQGILLLNYTRMFKKKNPIIRKQMYDAMWELNHSSTSEAQTLNILEKMKTESDLVGDHESDPTEMLVS